MIPESIGDDALLRRREAAAFLNDRGYKCAAATLAKLASIGGGPEFEMWSRFPMYRPRILLAWAQGRLSKPMRSTADRETSAAA